MRKQQYVSMLLLALGLPAALSGCGQDAEQQPARYQVELISDSYKGYFVSKDIRTLSVDGLAIQKANGDYVRKGDLIADLTDSDQKEVDALKAKLAAYNQKLDALNTRLEKLLSGDSSGNTDIQEELSDISDSIRELKFEMQQNQLDRSDTNLSYQKDIADLDAQIARKEERNQELAQLLADAEVQLEALLAEPAPEETQTESESAADSPADVQNADSDSSGGESSEEESSGKAELSEESSEAEDPVLLLQTKMESWRTERSENEAELSQLYADRDYRIRNYGTEIDKLSLTDKSNSEALKKYEKLYQQLSTASSSNSTIASLISSFEDSKETYQETLHEITQQIADYENRRIIAPYDAQLEIQDQSATLYSDALQFVFKATERQMEALKAEKNLTVRKAENIGSLTPDTVMYDSASSELGGTVYFKMIYDVKWDETTERILNGTSGSLYTEGAMLVPDSYIEEDADRQYVVIDGQRKEIKAEKTSEGWCVSSGLKEGDMLEQVGGEDDD